MTGREVFKNGKLTAKPRTRQTTQNAETGVFPLKLDSKRDCFIYLPKNIDSALPHPLALMLHGAGGDAAHGLSLLKSYADANNLIILAPTSRLYSWDIIASDTFGPDVIFINQSLEYVFERYAIDTSRIAIGGFSDGASYALCLGPGNGDLFTHMIAFSPGFSFTIEYVGKPLIFISHGVDDRILPINSCSRRIVPRLTKLGYNVLYKEFDGEHQIPHDISSSAIEWFLK